MSTIKLGDGVTIAQHPHGGMVRVIDPTRVCAGEPRGVVFPKPTLHQLFALAWLPITERLPTEDDANEYGDVDWSDGKTIWEGLYSRPCKDATHWRRIVLP